MEAIILHSVGTKHSLHHLVQLLPWSDSKHMITSRLLFMQTFQLLAQQEAFLTSIQKQGQNSFPFIFQLSSLHHVLALFIYDSYTPVQFRHPRTLNFIPINISLPIALGPDLSRYRAAVFLSSIILESNNGHLEFSVSLQPFVIGQSYQTVIFTSSVLFNNIIDRIDIVYLFIDLLSFQQYISSYVDRVYLNFPSANSINIARNLGIPQNFNPGIRHKCIISIATFGGFDSTGYNLLSFQDPETNMSSNINQIQSVRYDYASYQVMCIQNCNDGYLNISFSYQRCQLCTDTLPFCLNCTHNSNVICTKCFSGYFLLFTQNKCYDVCPRGYYNNINTGLCSLCNSPCETCNESLNCLTCRVGWVVEGGCTTVSGCSKALSPFLCVKCNETSNFSMVGKACQCAEGLQKVTHHCTNIAGCIATDVVGDKVICVLCNSMKGYILNNGICECKVGFSFNGTRCNQICGDGIQIIDKCDDGNTRDADGCSSLCQVEDNYLCSGGSSIKASTCLYSRYDITLSVATIEKTDFQNQGIFTFQLSPTVNAIADLNLTEAVMFAHNKSADILAITYSNGKLIVTVDYFEDLESFPASLTILLDPKHFLQENVSLAFSMTSDGAKLIVFGNLAFLALCKTLVSGLSVAIIVVFIGSLFVHKMIGVELLYPVQAVYVLHLIDENYTQIFGLLKYLALTSWNLPSFFKVSTNINSIHSNVVFSNSSQAFTLYLIIGTIFVALGLFAALRIAKEILIMEDRQVKTLAKIDQISLAVYNRFLFPMTAGFLLIYFLMANNQALHHKYLQQSHGSYIICLFAILASCIFFYEWKVLLASVCTQKPYLSMKHCYKPYIAVQISCILTTSILLCYRFYNVRFDSVFCLCGQHSLLFVWTIIKRPYKNGIHNVGVVFNLFPLLYFLSWSIAKRYFVLLQGQTNEGYLVVGLIVALFLSVLMSILRIAYIVWRKIKRSNEKSNEIKAKKAERLIKKEKNIAQLQRFRSECSIKMQGNNDFSYLNKLRKNEETKDSSRAPIDTIQQNFEERGLQSLSRKLKNRLVYNQETENNMQKTLL